jgi:hypothetical protein
MVIRLLVLLFATACGAKETYVPKAPNPDDFDVDVQVYDTSDTGGTAR